MDWSILKDVGMALMKNKFQEQTGYNYDALRAPDMTKKKAQNNVYDIQAGNKKINWGAHQLDDDNYGIGGAVRNSYQPPKEDPYGGNSFLASYFGGDE